MEITIKTKYANSIVNFISTQCTPQEVSNIKDYSKIQKGKQAFAKSIPELRKMIDNFNTKKEDEINPFTASLRGLQFQPEALAEKHKELNAHLQEVLQPFSDEIENYVKEKGDTEVLVTINEEEKNQIRLFFEQLTKSGEKEVTRGSIFWNNSDEYLDIANLLGCLQ